MKVMRSRYARGKALGKPIAKLGIAMRAFPFKNPLKGDYKKMAMAEVAMKGLGLVVGFKFKF